MLFTPKDFADFRSSTDVTDTNFLFKGATWEDIDKDPDLQRYLQQQLDPDGKKYNGDLAALKQDFLNQRTRNANSVVNQVGNWLDSRYETTQARQQQNLFGRLYESSPDRFTVTKAATGQWDQGFRDALWEGLRGSVFGNSGEEMFLNLLLAPLSLGSKGLSTIGSRVLGKLGAESAERGFVDAATTAAIKRGAMWESAKEGAFREAAINAPLNVAGDLADQSAGINRELQSGYDPLQAAAAGALGAGVGGAFGAVGGALAGRRLGNELVGNTTPDIMSKFDGPRNLDELTAARDAEKLAERRAADEQAKAKAAAAQQQAQTVAVDDRFDQIRERFQTQAAQFDSPSAMGTYASDTLRRAADMTEFVRRLDIDNENKRLMALGATDQAAEQSARLRAASAVREWIGRASDEEVGDTDLTPNDLMAHLAAFDSTLDAMMKRDLAARAGREVAQAQDGPRTGPKGGAVKRPGPPAGSPEEGNAALASEPPPGGGQGGGGAAAPAPDGAAPAAPAAHFTPEVVAELKSRGRGAEAVEFLRSLGADPDDLASRWSSGEKIAALADEVSRRAKGVSPAAVATLLTKLRSAYDEVVRSRGKDGDPAAPDAPAAAPAAPEPKSPGGDSGAAAAPAETPASPEAALSALESASYANYYSALSEWFSTRLDRLDELFEGGLDEAKFKELLDNEEAGPLLAGVEFSKLGSAQGRIEAKAIVRRNAGKAMSALFADAVSKLMPDPLNVGAFKRLLDIYPGIPEARRAMIFADYRKMVGDAIAGEIGRLGSVDLVKQRYGAGVIKQLYDIAGTTDSDFRRRVFRKGQYRDARFDKEVAPSINFSKMLDEVAGDLSADQRNDVARIGRDFFSQLGRTQIPKDADVLRQAVYARMLRAAEEVRSGEWAKRNPDDAKRLEILRRLDASGGIDGEVLAQLSFGEAGKWGEQGALVPNVIIHRIAERDAGGAFVRLGATARIVSGRSHAHKTISRMQDEVGRVQGLMEPTFGFGFTGELNAHPSRLFVTTRRIYRQIQQAALARTKSDGKRVRNAAPTVSGMKRAALLDDMADRVEAARMNALLKLASDLEDGKISAADFEQRVASIGKTKGGEQMRAYAPEEIAAARDFAAAMKMRKFNEMAALASTQEVLNYLERYSGQGARDSAMDTLHKLHAKLKLAVEATEGNLMRALEKMSPAAKETEAQRAAEAARRAEIARRHNLEPDVVVLMDDSTRNYYEVDPRKALSLTYHRRQAEMHDAAGAKVADVEIVEGIDINLFGERIGKAKKTGTQFDVVLDSGLKLSGLDNVADVIYRVEFINAYKNKILEAKDKLTAAPEFNGSDLPEVGSVTYLMSKTAEIDSASGVSGDAPSIFKNGVVGDDDYLRKFSEMPLPPGRRWAVRMQKGGETTILPVGKSHRTIMDVIGAHVGNALFEIGTVPETMLRKTGRVASPFTSQKFAKETFFVLGQGTPNPDPVKAARLAEIAAARAENAPALREAWKGPATMETLAKIKLDGGKTAADLARDFEARSVGLSIDRIKTRDEFDALLKTLEAQAEQLEAVAPHGIQRTQAGRRSAFKHLRDAMMHFSPEVAEEAVNALRRVHGDGRAMPYIHSGPGKWDFDIKSNKIKVGARFRIAGQPVIPEHMLFVHELAHWAYVNILSPTEQVQFVRSLAKHYDLDGNFSMESVRRSLPNIAAIEEAFGGRPVMGIERGAANEIFAHSFMDWFMQRHRGEASAAAAEDGLWRRVVRYIANLIESFRRRPVDPDLVPLFERIMPASPLENRYRLDSVFDTSTGKEVPVSSIASEAGGDTLRASLNFMRNLDEHRRTLDKVLYLGGSANEIELKEALRESGKYIFGALYGGDKNEDAAGRRLGPSSLTLPARKARANILNPANPELPSIRRLFSRAGNSEVMEAVKLIEDARASASKAAGDTEKAWAEDLANPDGVVMEMSVMSPEEQMLYLDSLREALAEAMKRTDKAGLSDEEIKAVRERISEGVRNFQESNQTVRPEVYSVAGADTIDKMLSIAAQLRDVAADMTDTVAFWLSHGDENAKIGTPFRAILEKNYEPAKPGDRIELSAKPLAERLKERSVEQLLSEAEVASAEAARVASEGARLAARNRAIEPYFDELVRRQQAKAIDGLWDGTGRPALLTDSMKADALAKQLRASLAQGDYDVAREALWRYVRVERKERAARHAANVPVAAIVDENAAKAIAEEARERGLTRAAIGVPKNTDPRLKAIIGRITERDGKVGDAAQGIAYRLMKVVFGKEIPTNSGLAKLVGVDNTLPGAEVIDTSSPQFDALRELARQAARAVSTESGDPETAVNSLVDVLVRSYEGADKLSQSLGNDVQFADEANALLSATVKYQLDKLSGPARGAEDPLMLKDIGRPVSGAGAFREAAAKIVDRLSYILSGKVNKPKGKAKAVAARGNVLADAPSVPVAPLAPTEAKKAALDVIQALTPEQLRKVGEAVGMRYDATDADSLARAVLFYQPGHAPEALSVGEHDFGRGILLKRTADPSLSIDALSRIEEAADADALPLIRAVKAELEKLDDTVTSAADAPRVAELKKALLEQVRDLAGFDINEAALPVLVNPKRVFDLDAPPQRAVLAGIVRKAGKEVDGDAPFLPEMGKRARAGDARGVYEVLLQALGAERAAEVMRKSGFDALSTGNEVLVFSQESVKRMDDVIPTALEFNIAESARRIPVVGNLIGEMLGNPDARILSHGVQQQVLAAGGNEADARVASMLAGGARRPSVDDMEAFGRRANALTRALGTMSRRMRQAGAEYIANFVHNPTGSGFYERRDLLLGQRLMPVVDALDRLAGREGVIKWTSEIGRNAGAAVTGRLTQSASEERVALAMFNGSTAGLSADERSMVNALAEMFRLARESQERVGIPIADITGTKDGKLINRFYLPHRIDRNALMADPEGAIKAFSDYFIRESRRLDPELPPIRPLDEQAARERARSMVLRMIDDFEGDGFMMSLEGAAATALGKDLHARVLRMTDDDMRELGLHRFYDRNLRSLAVSYMKNSITREVMVEQFGVGGHALKSYLNIGQDGIEAAVNTMTKGRETAINRVAQNDPNVLVLEAHKLYSPLFDNEDEARRMLMQIAARVDPANPQSAANIEAAVESLTSLYQQRIGGFGMQEFERMARSVVHGLADFGVSSGRVQGDELSTFANFFGQLGGAPAYQRNSLSHRLAPASGALRTFNSVTLLSLATLASLSDLGMPLVRSGSFKAWAKGFGRRLAIASGDPATRSALRSIGTGIESVLNENVQHVHGGRMGHLGTAFFWSTGLTPWTMAMRDIAALTGFESIKANQVIVQRERAAGNVGSRAYLRALRQLRQLGVAHLSESAPLTDLARLRDDRVREAMLRFVNESVFQPNKNDIPQWAQDPIGAVLFQFKSYPMMLGRMMRRSIEEATAKEGGKWVGDVRPLLYLGAVGAALGGGSLALRDIITQRNEEDPGAVRDRNLSRIMQGFGFKDWQMDSAGADAFLGWWIEGLVQMGAMGMIGDMLYQTTEQLDNGSYGAQRVASVVFGPSVGTFFDALKVAEGAWDEGDLVFGSDTGESNAKERAAIRAVAGRVPGAGKITSAVNAFVDDWAGERETERPQQP